MIKPIKIKNDIPTDVLGGYINFSFSWIIQLLLNMYVELFWKNRINSLFFKPLNPVTNQPIRKVVNQNGIIFFFLKDI
jgi:hypothetical protein